MYLEEFEEDDGPRDNREAEQQNHDEFYYDAGTKKQGHEKHLRIILRE
jgi:hypothetical protein